MTEHTDRHYLALTESVETHLCTNGVDSDGAVQLVFGQPTFQRRCEALGHFSSIWTQYVEAHNTFLRYKKWYDYVEFSLLNSLEYFSSLI